MSEELVLYQFPQCPYCAYVLSEIRRLGISVELRNTRENDHYRKELIQKTGKSQVPCLFINEEPMFESADIVKYLQARFEK